MSYQMGKGPSSGGSTLAIVTLTVSVIVTVLLVVAAIVFRTSPGLTESPDGQAEVQILVINCVVSVATSALFASTVVALQRWKGGWRALLPTVGAIGAFVQLPLMAAFALGFMDCGDQCTPPAPSLYLWPAFYLAIGCVFLGLASAIRIARSGRAAG